MISDSLKMKITAAVLSAIFSGSYISCAVIEAVTSCKKEMIENESASLTILEPEAKNGSGNGSSDRSIDIAETGIANDIIENTASTVTKKQTESSESTKKAVTTEGTTVVSSTSETVQTSENTQKTASEPKQTTAQKETSVSEKLTEPEQSSPVSQKSTPAPGGSVPESAARGDDYFQTCAFIGDSHVEGLKYIVPADRVLAKNGLNLSRIAETIPVENAAALKPEHIYIMMGTNGVSWMSHSSMISDYTNYINSLQNAVPGADIYVMSIPPVTAAKSSKSVSENGIPNSMINEYNELVSQMCKDNGWHFLDIHSAVADSSGCLTNDSTDGVHMPVGVYKNVIKNYLLTHVA